MVIPYGRQSITDDDICAVTKALNSDFLTTGPGIIAFEDSFAKYVGAKYAVVVSSGTAALHLAYLAAGLRNDDELITTPMTFCATANAALFCQALPVFVDIKDDGSGLIDQSLIPEKITEKTKIIVPVHYAGQPCDMKEIKEIADKHNLVVIEDACHALGATYKDTKIGDCTFSDMSVFSFHPVKHITTGEGGMITTNSEKYYTALKKLRNHGLVRNRDELRVKNQGPWYYEMQELGFNYRITDFQCALGQDQLTKIDEFVNIRREIAKKYDEAFLKNPKITPINQNPDRESAYHLYVILTKKRLDLYNHLKDNNIQCQVHYIPVPKHPYYQDLGYKTLPRSDEFYSQIISIPIYYELGADHFKVIEAINGF